MGVREVLAEMENYSELAREQGTSPEWADSVFFSRGTVLSGSVSGTGCPANQPRRGEGTTSGC